MYCPKFKYPVYDKRTTITVFSIYDIIQKPVVNYHAGLWIIFDRRI